MAGNIVSERRISPDAADLTIGGRFKGFGPESEISSGRAEVREVSGAVAKLKAEWRRSRFDFNRVLDDRERYIQGVMRRVRHIDYSAEDVEGFSLELVYFKDEKYFPEKAGHFLTALMRNGKEDSFTIHTNGLPPVQCLGYRNRKDITVHGDVGVHVGMEMQGGVITVKGDAGGPLGMEMMGGQIIIEGNAGHCAGWKMHYGSITINGNASSNAGYEMTGGEIIVNGSADYWAGKCMNGGVLAIKGNVGDFVGEYMKDGQIVVGGDTGLAPGRAMAGGTLSIKGNGRNGVGIFMSHGIIHVEGEIENFEPEKITGGRIFHKGELVFGK